MSNTHASARRALSTGLALLLAGLVTAVGWAEEPTPPPQPHTALLDPALATETAPDTYAVRMETTAGSFVITVHRDWAPHAADRFYNLVRIGYYDDVAFYRVIDGFMAQAGMHGDPAVNRAWSSARIPDDPVRESNTAGRVTFAMSAQPNSRTTQFFINFGDNSYLDASGFAPFGEVTEGFETVRKLHSGYGEGAPRGRGPSQPEIAKSGDPYLKAQFPELDRIVSARLIE